MVLCSVRYDRSELVEMLGGSRMGLVEAILEGSSLVREKTDSAREEGLSEGRMEGAWNVLHGIVAGKFPGLETMPEIGQIKDAGAIAALTIEVAKAGDRITAAEAIVKAFQQISAKQ